MSKLTAVWKQLASSTRLARSSQTLTVVSDTAFIFGGELEPRKPVDNQIDVVDLTQDGLVQTLETPTVAPSPRVGSASARLQNVIYIFSGRGGTAMAPIEEAGGLWAYDTVQRVWTFVQPEAKQYPAARSYHTMTSDGQSKLYLHAGCPEIGRLGDLWSFDVGRKEWKQLANAPDPPRGGATIAFSGGQLYRMNGFDGKHEQGGCLDVYNPVDDTWSTIPYMPDGRSGPEARSVSCLVAMAIDSSQYLVTLFGEHDPSSLGHAGAGKMLDNVWAFHIDRALWSKVMTNDISPAARGWFDADVAISDTGSLIIMHGGLAEDNSRLGDVWSLSFQSNATVA